MVEIFEKNIIRSNEIVSPSQLDISILKKRSKAKNFKTWLIQGIKQASQSGNIETGLFLQEIYRKYGEYEKTERVCLENWKGHSSFTLFEKPDRFIVITYQKAHKGAIPKEISREILKKDINLVVKAIWDLRNNKFIESKEVARSYCILAGIKENNEGRPLFEEKGFIYQHFFGDRGNHTQLNLILRILSHKALISYRGGYISILNQENLVKWLE